MANIYLSSRSSSCIWKLDFQLQKQYLGKDNVILKPSYCSVEHCNDGENKKNVYRSSFCFMAAVKVFTMGLGSGKLEERET